MSYPTLWYDLIEVARRELELGGLLLFPGAWHRANELPVKSLDATLARFVATCAF